MAKHRFYRDLKNLEEEPLVGHYHLLVVGSFNVDDEGGLENEALWFYGRPVNEFWCFLPRMMDSPTLHQVDSDKSPDALVEDWKIFCRTHKVIIVDVFKEIFKDLKSHSDDELQELRPAEYNLFDYKRAFEQTTFDGVLFTWKEQKKRNTLTSIKEDMCGFLSNKSRHIMHMVTPANSYPKSRFYKLSEWKREYGILKGKLLP